MNNPGLGAGLGYALAILALLIWAGNSVVGRVAPEADIPPFALNFWRWAVAFAVLLPFALPRLRAQADLLKAHWRLCLVFGASSIAGFNSLLYVALQTTTVVQATMITAILPIIVLIGARLFLAQPIARRQVMGVAVSISGVALIVVRGDLAVVESFSFNRGDVWMLIAVSLWAGQTILIRLLPRGMDLIAFQVVAIAVGLMVIAPLYLTETLAGQPMPVTREALLAIGYTGLFASALGFTFWNMGVIRIGPQIAGYLGNLHPVFGTMLGVLILGEAFRWYHLAGALAILAGIYLATAATARAEAKA